VIKIANILYFLSELLKPVSTLLAKAQPAYNSMLEANKKDKYIGDLDSKVNETIK